ncbi:prepilin-type N-terminal cleavage/methylation domain-containing protein [Endozoicomonas ascidiicola]
MLVLKRREHGFTLIELLITVIIIAISISLVTPIGQIAGNCSYFLCRTT